MRYPCFYGIDTPSSGDLVAARYSPDDMSRTVGADSLRYLSREDMIGAIGLPPDSLCTACFDGNYIDDGDRRAVSNGPCCCKIFD